MPNIPLEHHRFDVFFPLPYRIALQIILGIWGWGLNVKALAASDVDMSYLLRYQKHGSDLQQAVLSFAKGVSLVFCISMIVYWIEVHNNPQLELGSNNPFQIGDILPWLTLMGLLILLLYPRIISGFHREGRIRFSRVFLRIMTGGLDQDHRLSDVLVADVLTSYTKSLVDLSIVVCAVLHGKTCLGMPDRHCGGHLMVPIVSAFPFLIRLRQCVTEYRRTGNKTHLLNALKYASGLPVVLLSALQRRFAEDDANDAYPLFNDRAIWVLWLFAVFVNSTYSFVWDVTFDWDLPLLTSKQALKNGGLRPVLHFPSKYWYYMAIALDYVLRFSWSLKISSHWYEVTDREGGLFILGLLEIFRRWIWMFFRIESEWVKNIRSLNFDLGVAPDVPLKDL